MRLLLTGFEPFGDGTVNPSELVVRRLQSAPPPGVELATAILPVDRHGGPARLLQAVAESRPEAVLCLGQASGRMFLSIERIAVNLLDYPMADNAGFQARDESIAPGGPAAYFATLPVRAILQAVRSVHVPVELSLSAGAFLCNQVLYELLHSLHVRGQAIPAGFIHVPAMPEQAANRHPAIPSMSVVTMTTGIRAAIRAIAGSVRPT